MIRTGEKFELGWMRHPTSSALFARMTENICGVFHTHKLIKKEGSVLATPAFGRLDEKVSAMSRAESRRRNEKNAVSYSSSQNKGAESKQRLATTHSRPFTSSTTAQFNLGKLLLLRRQHGRGVASANLRGEADGDDVREAKRLLRKVIRDNVEHSGARLCLAQALAEEGGAGLFVVAFVLKITFVAIACRRV